MSVFIFNKDIEQEILTVFFENDIGHCTNLNMLV